MNPGDFHTPMHSDISKFYTALPSPLSYDTEEGFGHGEHPPYENMSPVRGERALWQAVITQALMDARMKGENNEDRHIKYQALHWLTAMSKDFQIVCHYANFDPGYVKRKSAVAIKRNCVWRKPRKGGNGV